MLAETAPGGVPGVPPGWPPAGLDRIVDAHVHFWDVARLDLYPHLAPDVDPASLGVPAGGDIRVSYGPADHQRHADSAAIGATVHVNAMRDRANFELEMCRLEEVAGRFGFPQAVIGKVDLTVSAAELAADLRAYERHPAFRGVRVLGVSDWGGARLHEVFAWARDTDRVIDLGVHPDQVPACVSALERYTPLRVAVEHAGWPRQDDVRDPRVWRAGLTALAAMPSVPACKISGLPMALQTADFEVLRNWVVPVLDAFGAARCMFASNFPVDSPVAPYLDIARAYARIVGDWGGPAAVRAVFRDTAESFYQLSAAGSAQ